MVATRYRFAQQLLSFIAVLPIWEKHGNPNHNDIYIGYDTSGTATTTRTTTIDIPTTNPGSKYIYPVVKIHRANDGTSATLNSLENVTTGKKLQFNYALQAGETLTINLTPGSRSSYQTSMATYGGQSCAVLTSLHSGYWVERISSRYSSLR